LKYSGKRPIFVAPLSLVPPPTSLSLDKPQSELRLTDLHHFLELREVSDCAPSLMAF